jgi:hypothetical protein
LGGKKIEIEMKKDVDTKVDDTKPTTQIQIQFVNGEKVKATFNLSQNVSEIYDWVEGTSGLKSDTFELLVSYPKKNLSKEKNKTIEESNLSACVLIQHANLESIEKITS